MNVFPYTNLNGLFPAICCVWLRPISMPRKAIVQGRWSNVKMIIFFLHHIVDAQWPHKEAMYSRDNRISSWHISEQRNRRFHVYCRQTLPRDTSHSLVKHMYNYVYIMYNIYMRVWVRGVWGKYVLLLSSIWCIYNAFYIHIMHLNHLPLDKMATIWQTTFPNAFHWIKLLAFWFNIHCNLFLRVPLTMNQQWFR